MVVLWRAPFTPSASRAQPRTTAACVVDGETAALVNDHPLPHAPRYPAPTPGFVPSSSRIPPGAPSSRKRRAG